MKIGVAWLLAVMLAGSGGQNLWAQEADNPSNRVALQSFAGTWEEEMRLPRCDVPVSISRLC